MMIDLRTAQRIKHIVVFGVVGGFILAVIFATARAYHHDYGKRNGLVLADGSLLGGDFVCFYVAGQLFQKQRKSLYDYETQIEWQRRVIGQENVKLGPLQFIYPPLVAFFFSLLTPFSFPQAYFVWTLISISLSMGSLWFLLTTLSTKATFRLVWVVMLLAFIPFSVSCLGAGQTSSLGFAIYTLVFVLLKSNKDFWAGVVLGCAYYKPPLFMIFILYMILRKRFEVIAGLTLSLMVLSLASVALVGADGVLKYLELASSNTYGRDVYLGYSPPLEKGVSLLPFLHLIFADRQTFVHVLYFISVLGFMIVDYNFRVSRESKDRHSNNWNLAFATDLSMSLLLSPYLMVYDLTILLIPFSLAFACGSYRSAKTFSIIRASILTIFYSEFLVGTLFLEKWNIQLFTLCLIAWTVFSIVAAPYFRVKSSDY